MDFSGLLSSPLGIALIGVLAFVIGGQIFGVKQIEAHWKQWAIDTSNAMTKAGLTHLPKVLNALAVGDIAGAFKEVKSLADIFKDPAQLQAEFKTIFSNMLTAAFADPTQAKNLQQLANDAVAAFASGNPKTAAGQLSTDLQSIVASNPMFSNVAANGLSLSLMPALAADPALAAIAGLLQQAGQSHLLPGIVAAAQQADAASAAMQPTSPPKNTSDATPKTST